ncbi:reductase [Weissella soli]|uniref:reductase n=1 Tax=Weissella soli TaxID=155866 RepID=UPI0011BBB882|nr:reductase [Weissella soli]QEA34944.1 reductase [Weissella soli]
MLSLIDDEQPKIAMGLTAGLPEFSTLAGVQREIEWYQSNQDRELFMWQDPLSKHYTVVIGVEQVYSSVIVRLIAFGPEVDDAHRKAVGHDIYQALQQRYPKQAIMGTISNQKIVSGWAAYE